MKSSIITLTTDFGTRDGFVGAMKGRILSLFPSATIVDITHDIQPFSVIEAAFTLLNFFSYYPENTIHVVVVDPGVGSNRRELIVKIAGRYIICPDNGLLSLLVQDFDLEQTYVIRRNWQEWVIAPTFHGRDIFAPAAAMLARGESIDSIADLSDQQPVLYSWPVKLVGKNQIILTILHIDRFGNIITNLTRKQWDQLNHGKQPKLKLKKGFIYGIHRTFSEVQNGQLLMFWDSSGYLAIGRNQGNAAALTGLHLLDEVVLEY